MTKEGGALGRGSASEVCGRFALGDEARALLDERQTPGELLELLSGRRLDQDATRLIAHALPRREAVWWALVCAREAAGTDPPPAIAAALRAAEAWVREPSEAHRRAASDVAEAAGFGTPAGCAALAAFWSGGSLAPANHPAVPPAEHLTAHAAASAVMLAVVQSEPEKAAERYRAFLDRGVDVADGVDRWAEPAKAEPTKPQAPAADGPAVADRARRPVRRQWE